MARLLATFSPTLPRWRDEAAAPFKSLRPEVEVYFSPLEMIKWEKPGQIRLPRHQRNETTRHCTYSHGRRSPRSYWASRAKLHHAPTPHTYLIDATNSFNRKCCEPWKEEIKCRAVNSSERSLDWSGRICCDVLLPDFSYPKEAP